MACFTPFLFSHSCVTSIVATPVSLPARREAQGIYVPVILGLNLFYVFLKYIRASWLESVVWETFFLAVFGVTYYLLYTQILDHAMNRSARDTGLIGGHWLDVLAVLAVIQIGTAFSTRFYWLLWVLPAWGAWSLYQTVMGKGGLMGAMTGGGGGSNTASSSNDAPVNRKQRRTEQRSQRR